MPTYNSTTYNSTMKLEVTRATSGGHDILMHAYEKNVGGELVYLSPADAHDLAQFIISNVPEPAPEIKAGQVYQAQHGRATVLYVGEQRILCSDSAAVEFSRYLKDTLRLIAEGHWTLIEETTPNV